MITSLKQHLQSILGRVAADRVERIILAGASGTLLIRVGTAGLAFLLHFTLARALGPEGYGAYAYGLAWVVILGVAGRLGSEELVLREAAVCRAKSCWSEFKGLLKLFGMGSCAAATLLFLAAVPLLALLDSQSPSSQAAALTIMLLTLPLHAMGSVLFATIRSLNRVVLALIPGQIVQPALLLALTVGWLFFGPSLLSPSRVALFYAISILAAFLLQLTLFVRLTPKEVFAAKPAYRFRPWMSSTLPFILVGGMNIINSRADTIMLGTLADQTAVGIYNVAGRGAELASFVMMAIEFSLAPVIASLYSNKDMVGLQKVVTKSVRTAFLVSLPVLFALFWGRHLFMGIFGPEFVVGSSALAILCFSKLVNVALGSGGVILNMTGDEKLTAFGVGLGALVNITLNFWFIPRWGANGAALTCLISMLVWNGFHSYWAIRKLGINPTIFSHARNIHLSQT